MEIQTKAGRKIHMPTSEVEAQIQKGMKADPDNPEWTDEDLANARPAAEFFGPEVFAKLPKPRRQRGLKARAN